MKPKARVIAMYLPQYYPIPENDKVWGKGFTEWNNVVKGRPLFRGHHQPNIPADLGFYDLRLPEIREQQAALARNAGIEGFMYWHYWMGNGKRLLSRPIDEVLATGKPDFPFCFGWANHSWKTSTWTTMGNFEKDHIICEQKYPGDEDYIAHFNWCLKAFNDPRYIKVDGKPFFLIYEIQSMPDSHHFVNLWNQLAIEQGFPGVHFVALANGYDSYMDVQLGMGADAVVHGNIWQAQMKNENWYYYAILNKIRPKFDLVPLLKYKYKDIIKYLVNENDKRDNIYPCLIPGWDRSPRSGRKAVIFYDSSPKLWKKHVEAAVAAVQNKCDEHKIIMLRSWNEWGEGNYVEPDERWGTAYLDALSEVLLG